MDVVPIAFRPPFVTILDQSRLPAVEVTRELRTLEDVEDAVRTLAIRGAPLLGIMGAAAMAIVAETLGSAPDVLTAAAHRIGTIRPTAVELATGAAGALRLAREMPERERREALWGFAERYLARRIAEDRQLSALGAALLPPGCAVLTHCNTGALATGGIGTALGVVRVAWEQGKLTRCYATETRPLLQGARLTAWELNRLGIPASLLPDTAAASLVASGRVQAVITGADRIAANGDSANKVGTYGLAAVAHRHGVPFYIAAPRSTIDPSCDSGEGIPIEFRDAREVGGWGDIRWAPDGIEAYNPAFDVTPAALIAGIITEAGVARPSYEQSLAALLEAP